MNHTLIKVPVKFRKENVHALIDTLHFCRKEDFVYTQITDKQIYLFRRVLIPFAFQKVRNVGTDLATWHLAYHFELSQLIHLLSDCGGTDRGMFFDVFQSERNLN